MLIHHQKPVFIFSNVPKITLQNLRNNLFISFVGSVVSLGGILENIIQQECRILCICNILNLL